MKSRNLSDRTKYLLKEWFIGNLPEHKKEDLIIILIDELGTIKKNQAEKIRKIYYP